MRAVLTLFVFSLLGSCTCVAPERPAGERRQAPSGSRPDEPEPSVVGEKVRQATSAGRFYPGTAEAIRTAVDSVFAGVTRPTLAGGARMVLVPHAGWEYSGVIGATAMTTLDRRVERLVILAANHDGDAQFSGVSVERSTHWELPGLRVRVDPESERLLRRPGFVDVPEAHGMHMIESELPLLAHELGTSFSIVPLIVGHLGRDDTRVLARELARLAGPKTAFVFSVDLSHFYPYERAVSLDRPCLEAIERMDADDAARCDTDGTHVLLTMMELAAIQRWTPRLLAYRNSGDVTGERDNVVGYGAMAFEDRLDLTSAEEQVLLELARSSLVARVRDGRALRAPAALMRRFPRLGAPGMAFVTLRKSGDLRGCIGSLEATQPLAEDVAENAAHAAVDDRRFPPVEPPELAGLDLSISVLGEPRPFDRRGMSADDLAAKLGREHPGVVLGFEGRHSTFLPSVWEELPDPVAFLGQLCRKQGSPAECWRDPSATYELYGAEHVGAERSAAP